jgi:hypothetical protein
MAFPHGGGLIFYFDSVRYGFHDGDGHLGSDLFESQNSVVIATQLCVIPHKYMSGSAENAVLRLEKNNAVDMLSVQCLEDHP